MKNNMKIIVMIIVVFDMFLLSCRDVKDYVTGYIPISGQRFSFSENYISLPSDGNFCLPISEVGDTNNYNLGAWITFQPTDMIIPYIEIGATNYILAQEYIESYNDGLLDGFTACLLPSSVPVSYYVKEAKSDFLVKNMRVRLEYLAERPGSFVILTQSEPYQKIKNSKQLMTYFLDLRKSCPFEPALAIFVKENKNKDITLPVHAFVKPKIIYNKMYELRLYYSEKACNDPEGQVEMYYPYSYYALSKLTVNPTITWAKIVHGKTDKSFCAKGKIENNKVVFNFVPNTFGEKRIVIVISNSKGVAEKLDGRSIWQALIQTMIDSYKAQKPVTLTVLNEDQALEYVVRSEDLATMTRSSDTSNQYPELTKHIRSKVTMDGIIQNPMKVLDAVYEYFKNDLEKVIYITDSYNMPNMDNVEPEHTKMPLYWWKKKISFYVITNEKHEVWEEATAERCFSNANYSTLMRLIQP